MNLARHAKAVQTSTHLVTSAGQQPRGRPTLRWRITGAISLAVLLLGVSAWKSEEDRGAWKGFRFVDTPKTAMRTNSNTCRVRYYVRRDGHNEPIDAADVIEIDESVRNRHMIHHELRRMCAQMARGVNLRADVHCRGSMSGKQIVRPTHSMCKSRRFARKGSWRPDGE